MRILPVIDLLRGAVVRGIAGDRASYRAIVSRLASDAQPATVARAFVELGFSECYVADLDAIAGAEPDWPSYQALTDAGLAIWLDAGCGSAARAEQLTQDDIARIVVGLESLESEAALSDIIESLGHERLVFSIDLKHGTPLSRPGVWPGKCAIDIAESAGIVGVQQFLMLDLAAVGMYGGPATLELCAELRRRFPSAELTSGGGVRNEQDLEAFASAGCNVTLVASALHDGRIHINGGGAR